MSSARGTVPGSCHYVLHATQASCEQESPPVHLCAPLSDSTESWSVPSALVFVAAVCEQWVCVLNTQGCMQKGECNSVVVRSLAVYFCFKF